VLGVNPSPCRRSGSSPRPAPWPWAVRPAASVQRLGQAPACLRCPPAGARG
jgi:hypothetical protein